jgi:hypothetical protein
VPFNYLLQLPTFFLKKKEPDTKNSYPMSHRAFNLAVPQNGGNNANVSQLFRQFAAGLQDNQLTNEEGFSLPDDSTLHGSGKFYRKVVLFRAMYEELANRFNRVLEILAVKEDDIQRFRDELHELSDEMRDAHDNLLRLEDIIADQHEEIFRSHVTIRDQEDEINAMDLRIHQLKEKIQSLERRVPQNEFDHMIPSNSSSAGPDDSDDDSDEQILYLQHLRQKQSQSTPGPPPGPPLDSPLSISPESFDDLLEHPHLFDRAPAPYSTSDFTSGRSRLSEQAESSVHPLLAPRAPSPYSFTNPTPSNDIPSNDDLVRFASAEDLALLSQLNNIIELAETRAEKEEIAGIISDVMAKIRREAVAERQYN